MVIRRTLFASTDQLKQSLDSLFGRRFGNHMDTDRPKDLPGLLLMISEGLGHDRDLDAVLLDIPGDTLAPS